MELKRLSHACFKIKGNGLIIYIDPYDLDQPDQADLILITHDHYDHCSIKDIEKIRKEDTTIIATAGCSISGDIKHMKPGDRMVVKGIEIEAVAAYNIGKPFHPKEKSNLGYIITIEGKRIYHAGDTDLISEMNSISPRRILHLF